MARLEIVVFLGQQRSCLSLHRNRWHVIRVKSSFPAFPYHQIHCSDSSHRSYCESSDSNHCNVTWRRHLRHVHRVTIRICTYQTSNSLVSCIVSLILVEAKSFIINLLEAAVSAQWAIGEHASNCTVHLARDTGYIRGFIHDQDAKRWLVTV